MNSKNTEFDEIYHIQVKDEKSVIAGIVSNCPVNHVTIDEFEKAPKTIHKGKTADIFGKKGVPTECTDMKTPAHVVLLDAKSAFDVADHSQLLRRLYHADISDGHWLLMKSLHESSSSVIKYKSHISDPFSISQGVRHGGILSTDLYKLYVNPLLDRLADTGRGGRIGTTAEVNIEGNISKARRALYSLFGSVEIENT
ncbi:hypothetical protein DPMN_191626 [Dreissena polymorpha]|uniref:Reverse transcriptase domain-containing protein n=1 Tax=Dreissena polymorpha TaxID=45954 RepID=A0A9D3Y4R7_DREPO|nr:hypothetical protein DPMN_191626 [Dreissena polymorpha]